MIIQVKFNQLIEYGKYDFQAQSLKIKFKTSHKEYVYQNVTADIAHGLMRSEDPVKYYNSKIKKPKNKKHGNTSQT